MGEESYLLLDEYGVHKVGWLLKMLSNCNTEVDFVLAGKTGVLQVLDVGINKPFKDYIRRKYDNFMVTKQPKERVTRLRMATWVNEAWNEISEETIFNSWRKVGFIP